MHKLAGDRYILTFYECTKIKEINEILRNFANRKIRERYHNWKNFRKLRFS